MTASAHPAPAAPEPPLFVDGIAPFAMVPAEKASYLAARLAELLVYHRERCAGYAQLVGDWERNPRGQGDYVDDYPFVSVTVFKEHELRSVVGEVAVVESSATTSKQASRIFIDKASRKRQSRSANLILTDFVGAERRPYIVFDLEETVRGAKAFSARGAAILALAHMASEFHFVMSDTGSGPELDADALKKALVKIGDAPFIAYGFTFMLYNAHRKMAELDLPAAHPESVLLHSGGWKKLVELAVSKPVFNATVSEPWRLDPSRVIDFYGAVEQIGMPYPDCSAGYKHVPYWADVITRRSDTLAAAPLGESGLIQLISSLPLAAPNHSVLTEDLGRIVLADGCTCGRRGKAFLLRGGRRARKSGGAAMSPVVERLWAAVPATTDFQAQLATLRSSRGPGTGGIDARLAALNDLSDMLLSGADNLRSALPADGVAFLSAFLREANLRHLIAREIPQPGALEDFVAIGPRKSLRLLPRGLVCHWVAGNVPLLAVFSWALSAAVGNANVIRLSSRQGDVMSPLLRGLAGRSDAGRRMADETLVVSFDRSDQLAHQQMSQAADVRIAWGGRDAVDAIRGLPTRWDCEDVVFGPRMSMAVIDPAQITAAGVTRLATDIVIFDQLACSSPQVIFLKGTPGEESFDGFLEKFRVAFAKQSASFQRHPLDFSETYRISLDRSRAILAGGSVIRDQGTQWTVAIMATPDDGIDCANRFVQVVPYKSLDEIYAFIPENAQTCVVQLPRTDLAEFTEQAAWRGVCRFPNPGEGNHFENPWDGIGLVSRLVRFVVRSEPGR